MLSAHTNGFQLHCHSHRLVLLFEEMQCKRIERWMANEKRSENEKRRKFEQWQPISIKMHLVCTFQMNFIGYTYIFRDQRQCILFYLYFFLLFSLSVSVVHIPTHLFIVNGVHCSYKFIFTFDIHFNVRSVHTWKCVILCHITK